MPGPAATTVCPALGASREATDGSAPTASPGQPTEHEPWDVLLACQGRLRLTPSGHVIGIEMDVALRIAGTRGYDLVVLSELLPAAEAGLIEALSIAEGQGDGP